jgi:glutamyl-tRNA synthetase
MDGTLRLRFAPSPTGHLHIGGARTALFNYLLARKTGGVFVLRLEDTDVERSTTEFEREILRDLRWLGLTWDEGPERGGPFGPYRQTERRDLYDAAIERMLANGTAYRCTCSSQRLDEVRETALANGQKPRYDGHCREMGLGASCGPHVIRFRMPEQGENLVDDLCKGPVTIRNEELDDFVIRRSDGVPTYNFAVVVDDWTMGITHVLRGDDHLNNTPKQIEIYKALGAPVPRFGHMPLILGPDGSRLSKRHGATSVDAYREMGYLPEALVNYLTRLGWSHGDMELFSVEEALEVFDVSDIGRSPSKWDMDKLSWVNQHWIQRAPIERLGELALPFFSRRGVEVDAVRAAHAVETVRSRSRTLQEAADMAHFYFVDDDAVEVDPKAFRKFLTPENASRLEEIRALLAGLPVWTRQGLDETLTAWVQARGLGLGSIAQPMRVSITGRQVGPGLFETLEVLGRDSVLRRIERALAMARQDAARGLDTPAPVG